jgi:hypothetical protein
MAILGRAHAGPMPPSAHAHVLLLLLLLLTRRFSRYSARPASAPVSSCPPALGPGAYFRQGAPPSLTGRAVQARHDRATGSNTGSTGDNGSGQQQPSLSHTAGGLWPLAWAPAAAAAGAGCVHCSDARQSAGACTHSSHCCAHREPCFTSSAASAPLAPAAHHRDGSRPGSAALQYARQQRATLLLGAAGANAQADPVAGCAHSSAQQQCAWPRALLQAALQRPASAGILGAGRAQTARPHGSSSTTSSSSSSKGAPDPSRAQSARAGAGRDATHPAATPASVPASSDPPPHGSNAKGGAWAAPPAKHSRQPATPAATELLYDPRPEVLGHMRRAPTTVLPLNRVAVSRKWAQAAARAALQ